VAKPPKPEPPAFLVGVGNVAWACWRLDALGRAQCTDLEAAAAAQLEGWEIDPDAPGVIARLAVARMAGLAAFRERQYAVAMGHATADSGQAVTLAWAARQYLGQTPAGVDEETRRKVVALKGMPRHELARQLRRALSQLEAPAGLRGSVVSREPQAVSGK